MQRCYEEAAKICPKGYTLVDNQGNPNAVIVPNRFAPTVVRGPNQLFVECKA